IFGSVEGDQRPVRRQHHTTLHLRTLQKPFEMVVLRLDEGRTTKARRHHSSLVLRHSSERQSFSNRLSVNQEVGVRRLRERQEWKFFSVLPQAARALAVAWWALLVLRGVLPAIFAITMGVLVGAVQRGGDLAAPLALVGVVFVLLQVLTPIHTAVSA